MARRRSIEECLPLIGSPNQAERVLAMQDLSMWAERDARTHAQLLPIFKRAVVEEPDRWTAIHAARGLARAGGPEAGRRAWLALLARDDADTVAATAYAMSGDALFAPDLIELLQRRPELTIRHAVLRSLGRMRVPEALPLLLDAISVPELRPDVVQAMEDLGDPRAIPALESLLSDTADAWEEDNHGPTLRVCDVAATAIARLRMAEATKLPPSASKPPPLPAKRRALWWLIYLATTAITARLAMAAMGQ